MRKRQRNTSNHATGVWDRKKHIQTHTHAYGAIEWKSLGRKVLEHNFELELTLPVQQMQMCENLKSKTRTLLDASRHVMEINSVLLFLLFQLLLFHSFTSSFILYNFRVVWFDSLHQKLLFCLPYQPANWHRKIHSKSHDENTSLDDTISLSCVCVWVFFLLLPRLSFLAYAFLFSFDVLVVLM